MKKILLIFLIFYTSLLFSESFLNTRYNSYNQFSTFQNQFLWNETLGENWRVSFLNDYTYSQNSYFDRSSKNTTYLYKVGYNVLNVNPFIVYEYNKLYNTGLPEDSVSINDKLIQKSGFGSSSSFFGNSLQFNQENKYVKLEGPFKEYYGWESNYRALYSKMFDVNYFDIQLHYIDKDIYLDRSNSKTAFFIYRYSNNFLFRSRFNHSNSDIYSYNQKTDKNLLNDYSTDLSFDLIITDNFLWKLKNITTYRRNEYQVFNIRDNWTFDNDLDYKLIFKTEYTQIYSGVNLALKKRYLKSGDRYRESFDKKFINGINWQTAIIDTIKFETTTSLLQNFHSKYYEFLDNDRYSNSYNLFLNKKTYRTQVSNSFTFSKGKQVYIDRLLSANNHDKLSYIWIPEIEYYFLNNYTFYNRYQIRADYEKFVWSEYLNDRFFRNLNAEWGISYKNYFNILHNNADFIDIYFAFILEHSETAENLSNQWIRNSSEYNRKFLMQFIYNNHFLNFRFQPLLKYFDKSFESEFQTDLSASLTKDFLFTFSINPVGKQFNKMIWRLNTSLQYRF